MSGIAIQVKNIYKQYTIVTAQKRNDTLRDQLTESLKSVFRRNGHRGKGKEVIWSLRDISFEVQQGEVLGIIGNNGAGKSTLLKILSQITEPTKGNAKIYGRIASLLEVGTGFHPELSGRENIFLNGAIIGMRKQEIKRKLDEIVDFAETGKFIDTPVKRYSSGMYVRLAFAVAAHLDSEILLMDEVLAVGDAAFQKKCLHRMNNIAKDGRTILFVSHNMVAINSLCGRTIWLNNGEIVEDGPSAQVVTRYLTESEKGTSLLEEVWDEIDGAPGNDMVRLHRVRVRPRDGKLSDSLTMQTPFLAEIEYWNLIADAHLHITLHLYTDQGLVAFTTGSYDSAWSSRPMPVGLFRSVCFFPGDLLNSGQHRFVVLVVKDTSSVIYKHESRMSFDILDLRERQGTWYGKEPGVVQPVLKWGTEYLGGVAEINGSGQIHLQE
jgi:lipopolysaccharide transport system ATP-binding protein